MIGSITNLAFWFHLLTALCFYLIFLAAFFKLYYRTRLVTRLLVAKVSLLVFIWSLLSLFGFFVFGTDGAREGIERVCGMYWLAELTMAFLLFCFEILFVFAGFIGWYVMRHLNPSNQPLSLFPQN